MFNKKFLRQQQQQQHFSKNLHLQLPSKTVAAPPSQPQMNFAVIQQQAKLIQPKIVTKTKIKNSKTNKQQIQQQPISLIIHNHASVQPAVAVSERRATSFSLRQYPLTSNTQSIITTNQHQLQSQQQSIIKQQLLRFQQQQKQSTNSRRSRSTTTRLRSIPPTTATSSTPSPKPTKNSSVPQPAARTSSTNVASTAVNTEPSSTPLDPMRLNSMLLSHIATKHKLTDPDLITLAAAIEPALSSATWRSRRCIQNQVEKYLQLPESRPDLPMDARVVSWLLKAKGKLKPSSLIQYGSTLRAVANDLGMSNHPTLDMFIKASRVMAADGPIKQAPAITATQLDLLTTRALEQRNHRLALSMYLATKTCSRWGDLTKLDAKSFTIAHNHLDANEILVLWGNKTKTSRARPFRATGFTIVREEVHLETMRLLKEEIQKLKKEEKFCPKSSQQMGRWMKKFPETAALTCHSFKRTALDRLMEKAMEGELDLNLIPLMAKHQDKNLQHFPESTIRYISNKVALAKAFKTQEATRLL